ncbi:MAG: insulinase family protein [Bryobacterales bacterium]|nr:insulinase family protein [Bryobacterales bacterium]MEB2361574.1 pitrilysin family protein [Bryobacterales bacterium]
MQWLKLTALISMAIAAPAADLQIPVEAYKLDNGMRIILSRDTSAPVVSVYMLYGVGARSETKGRTGFAHLFEHMMFQGSKNAPKGTMDKMIASAGGYLNGSTHYDYTDYYEVIPSNKLPVALWLEADRMRGLDITAENLTNQKEAVKQERRMRLDNQPYATAIVDLWYEVAFENWANSHSIIGSFEDLNAASADDVAKFFKTYYAPNNAILAIVGDLDIPTAKKLIQTYFGDIDSQPQPKHPDRSEPESRGAKHEVYKDPLAKVPGIIIGYPGPKRRSADYYALVMLDAVLTGGDSSRFQQNLVKGRQSVVQFETNLGWPFASYTDYQDPGVFGMFLLHKPDVTGKQILSQVEEELDKIRKDGVPAKELERAGAFLRSHRLRELQSSLGRAKLLAQHQLLDGDAGYINTEMDRFLAVTPEQVQSVANKYFKTVARRALEIIPAPEKPVANTGTTGGK